MTPLNIISYLSDKSIIGSDIYIKKYKNKIEVRMKRSPYTVTIPLRINADISYLVGVIMGDGNIAFIHRKNVSIYPRTKIKIFNDSKAFLKYINNLFYKIFSISGKIYKKKDKNCYVLEFNNKVICLYFTNVIGLNPTKKIELEIPISVKNPKFLKYFLAGLIDTDGYFTSNTFGIMMNGKNLNFLKDIKELSKNFYKLNFLGPHSDNIIFNGKIRSRAQINLSRYDNEKFRKTIPLKVKGGGPGKI